MILSRAEESRLVIATRLQMKKSHEFLFRGIRVEIINVFNELINRYSVRYLIRDAQSSKENLEFQIFSRGIHSREKVRGFRRVRMYTYTYTCTCGRKCTPQKGERELRSKLLTCRREREHDSENIERNCESRAANLSRISVTMTEHNRHDHLITAAS
jgi:hypothetical protein